MGIRIYIYIAFIIPFLLSSQSSWDLILGNNKSEHQSMFSNDYHVVFLLPFCSEKNDILFSGELDSLIANPELLTEYNFYKKTKISIDFYLGFLLSLKQFSNEKINISVFDIKEGDASKNILKNIVDQKKLNKVDLIVGPLYRDNFMFFSDIFDKKTPIISPFSKKEYIAHDNENVFQITPINSNQLSFLSKFILNNHIDDNILLIHRDTILESSKKLIPETDQFEIVTDTLIPKDIGYSLIFLNEIDTILSNFQEIKVTSNVIDSIHHQLDTLGMKNIIVIPSEDNVFVTDLLSKLHACRDTSMVVYCMNNFSSFDHISIYDLMDMQLTFPHNKLPYDKDLDLFIIDYYHSYNYIPKLKYASVGYEIGSYFIPLLIQYGDIINNVENYELQTILGTDYDFRKTLDGGYVNQAVSILRYHNFGYLKLD